MPLFSPIFAKLAVMSTSCSEEAIDSESSSFSFRSVVLGSTFSLFSLLKNFACLCVFGRVVLSKHRLQLEEGIFANPILDS